MNIKNSFKNIIILSFSLIIFSCSQNIAGGNWENSIKRSDGNSLVTSLSILETQDNTFTGSMSTNQDKGNVAQTLNFSGYISGNVLVIDKLSESSGRTLKESILTVSEDKKTLTLSPSGLIFTKK
ncbi:MAG: hypothetical protein H7263_12315 [Candidatus Sericytochromatia bacterium]|nr:hypothetical protein [Candidatus Sericytochromatia bacterium]